MKKCQKCGAEYEEDKKFCKRCGSPLLEVDKNSEQNDQDGFQDWKEHNEEAGDEQQSGKKKKKNMEIRNSGLATRSCRLRIITSWSGKSKRNMG